MLPPVAEVLADGTARIGRDVLHGCRVRSRRGNDNRLVHHLVVGQGLNDLCDRGTLLSDCHVDADDIRVFLTDDGVDGDGCFSRLPVTDDQLALATADRDHGVDCLQSRLQRLFHRLPVHNSGRQALDVRVFGRIDGTTLIDRFAQSVDNAPDYRRTHRNRHDALRTLHHISFADQGVFTEQHGTHVIFFQV